MGMKKTHLDFVMIVVRVIAAVVRMRVVMGLRECGCSIGWGYEEADGVGVS
jgi:hypothetical protein